METTGNRGSPFSEDYERMVVRPAEGWGNSPIEDSPITDQARSRFAISIYNALREDVLTGRGHGTRAIYALLEAIDLRIQRAVDASNRPLTPPK